MHIAQSNSHWSKTILFFNLTNDNSFHPLVNVKHLFDNDQSKTGIDIYNLYIQENLRKKWSSVYKSNG